MATPNPSDYDFGGKAHFVGGEVVLDFGLFEGYALWDVPTGYLLWAVREDFPEDLVTIMEEELEQR